MCPSPFSPWGQSLSAVVALALCLAPDLTSQETSARRPVLPQQASIGAGVGGGSHSAPVMQEMPALPDTSIREDVPFELTRDPVILKIEGLDSGTAKVPAYLKGDPYRLSFVSGDYTPPKGEKIDPELLKRRLVKGPIEGQTYGFVMFEGRITEAKMKRVQSYGVKLINFHTFQSYTAVIPYAALANLRADTGVRWVGYARHTQKMDPSLSDPRANRPGQVGLLVTVFDEDKAERPTKRLLSNPARASEGSMVTAEDYSILPGGPFQRALVKEGAEIRGYIAEMKLFFVTYPRHKLASLLDLDFVHYVELDGQMGLHHDRSTKMIGVDRLRGFPATNGKGSVMGIIDTGSYIRGSANPKGHRDLSKWVVGWDYIGGGVWNDTNGHGTHVLGTMVGTGTASNLYRGTAIGAGSTDTTRIFVAKAIPGSTSKSISAITRFRSLYTSGGKTTPRPTVVNGSYGSTTVPASGYPGTDSSSIAADSSVYFYGQTYVFSAGNSGGAYAADRWRSVGAPGVSKNALTVSNLYDWRSTNTIGLNTTKSPGTIGILPNWYEAIKITPSSTMHSIPVEGFSLRVRGSKTMTLTTLLYRSTGGKPGTLVRTGTMVINTTTAWRRTTFSSPYFMSPGQSFFIAFRTPSSGLTYNISTTGSLATYYNRKTSTSTWSGPSTRRWIYQVHATTEVGEVTESSSKGPTKDGRMKPNIGAPGRWIASAKTKTESSYTNKSGTSMSSPHVAGVTAIFQDKNVGWKYRPYSTKSLSAATANPLGGYISTSSRMRNYYQRQGLGCVDAYKATYSPGTSTTWFAGTSRSTQSSSSGGFYFNLAIPSDADRLMLVLNFDEKAPSTGASRACLADYDLYLDIPPYSSAMNVGEYSSRRAWDSWDWLHIYSSSIMSKIRGKTIRIKAYPRVKPGSGTTAKVAISYCVYRGSHPPVNSVSIFAPTYVKPNQLFTFTARANPLSSVTSNSLMRMTKAGGFSVLGMRFRSGDNLLRSFGGLLDWTLGNVYPGQSSLQTAIDWTMRKSSLGNASVCVELRSDNHFVGSTTSGKTYCKTICVDGVAPGKASGLASTTHPLNAWTNKTVLTMKWNKIIDSGCAGVERQAVRVASPSAVTPTSFTIGSSTTAVSVGVSSSTKPWYFSHRSRDRSKNLSSVGVAGPYWVDTSKPTLISVLINNNASWTKSLNVGVRIAASDTYSGVRWMRFSSNALSWTSWRSYSTASQSFTLSLYGGSTAQGIKRVYAQVRDRAGNVSLIKSDTIAYDSIAPVISSVWINAGAAYTNSPTVGVRVVGLGGPNRMRYSFNGSTWSSWFAYTTLTRSMSVGSYGGNLNTGIKTVYSQLMDAAGNVSAVKTDSIFYLKIPKITTVAGATWRVIHDNRISLTGSGFSNVNRVYVGATLITSKSSEDWHRGWFRILSDSKMEIYPPQNFVPGTYQCYVRNTGFASNKFAVKVLFNVTPKTGVPATLKSGKVLHVYTARGPRPATTVSVLTFSISSKPLVVPGLISLAHGGNTTTFIDPSFTLIPPAQLHNASTRTAHWAFPTPPGKLAGLIYWQSLMFDAAKPTQVPIPVSTMDVVKFYK